MKLKTVILLALACAFVLCDSSEAYAQSSPAIGNITSAGSSCSTTSVPTNCVILQLDAATGAATIELAGTFVGTMQFEAFTGTTWTNINCTPPNSTTAVSSATAVGAWQCNVAAYSAIRVRSSAYTSGTAAVIINSAHASAKSGGGAVYASGLGTSNVIPKGNGAGQLVDSNISDNGSGTYQLGGVDAAAPTAQVVKFQSVVAGTSNTAGASPTIQMSLGTGTGLPKPLLITGPIFATTGSTQQTAVIREVHLHTTANLIANNTAVLFCRAALPASGSQGPSTVGLIIRYSVEVGDGTNTQVETGIVTVNAVNNNAGTQTLGTPTKSGNVQTVSSGTLAVTFTETTNGSSVDVKITSNSSLTPTTHRAMFEIINMGGSNSVTLF